MKVLFGQPLRQHDALADAKGLMRLLERLAKEEEVSVPELFDGPEGNLYASNFLEMYV